MEYNEDDFLMISGIQHFSFCPRQWALIHIEQAWAENIKTIEGNIVHEHCHDKDFIEKRGDLLITRGMWVSSRLLGVTGQCDVVEFHRAEDGCFLYGRDGGGENHFQLNINGENQNRLMQIACSYVVRLCVWRRCWEFRF